MKHLNVPVAILGGGASGIAASISAARSGKSVVICERLDRLGKKILASGNGRCNLLNEDLNESFYNPKAQALVRSIFSKFGKDDILKLFDSLGLKTYSEEGRIFPITNQSSSVLKVMEMELKRLSVPTELNFEVTNISSVKNGFIITSPAGEISCTALIVASGGKSYPALGSDGSIYKMIAKLGHKVIDPVPSAVAITANDPMCHALQGQKIFASAKAIIQGQPVASAEGELLFTKYGLSGTAILDISREISISINRLGRKDVVVVLDMLPFMDEAELACELKRRTKAGFRPEDMVTGLLPNKFAVALDSLLKTKNTASISKTLKAKEFHVTGTRGWNEADFTAGGVDTSEVMPSLESKLKKGLYFAGEVLDVDGCRGGYNLAWAWASGYIAGASV